MNIDCCSHITSELLSAIGSLLTGVGAILLSIWAIRQYFKTREGETRLSIKLKKTCYNINNSFKVYFDISLENMGTVAIHTRKRFYGNSDKTDVIEYTYKDSIETVRYSVELQVKRVKQSKTALYYWFDTNQYEMVTDPINLLTDLEDPDDPKLPPFFIESKETYHLCCWLQLDKGLYEAKVIVVGSEDKLPVDFWHRRFSFEVK